MGLRPFHGFFPHWPEHTACGRWSLGLWFFVLSALAQKTTEAVLCSPPLQRLESTSNVLRRQLLEGSAWRHLISLKAQTFYPHMGYWLYFTSTVDFWWPCLDIFLQGMWSGQGCPAPRTAIKSSPSSIACPRGLEGQGPMQSQCPRAAEG